MRPVAQAGYGKRVKHPCGGIVGKAYARRGASLENGPETVPLEARHGGAWRVLEPRSAELVSRRCPRAGRAQTLDDRRGFVDEYAHGFIGSSPHLVKGGEDNRVAAFTGDMRLRTAYRVSGVDCITGHARDASRLAVRHRRGEGNITV